MEIREIHIYRHDLPGDLTDGRYADGLPESAIAALGGLAILINNVGVMRRDHAIRISA